jgi:hypothetical protein
VSATLKVNNFDSLNLDEVTKVLADIAAGVVIIPLESTQGYAAGKIIVLGQLGTEGSEKRVVQSITDATHLVVTVATDFAHKRFEPVTKVLGDQIKLYTAPNADGSVPADSSFSPLSGGVFNIDFDQLTTSYTDSNGSSSVWYKFTYYSATGPVETDIAASNASRGGGYGRYTTNDAIRAEAGFNGNPNILDSLINSRRIDAEDEVNSELVGIYTIPFSPVPPTIARITREIAAGLLLSTEYGAMATGTSKDGTAKLKEARELLSEYKSREKTLIDATGTSLVLGTAAVVSSWPNDTTRTLGDRDDNGDLAHGGDTQFRMAQKF